MSTKGSRACGPLETGESLPPFLLSEPVWVFVAWQETIALAEVLLETKPYMIAESGLCSVLLEILGDVSSQAMEA